MGNYKLDRARTSNLKHNIRKKGQKMPKLNPNLKCILVLLLAVTILAPVVSSIGPGNKPAGFRREQIYKYRIPHKSFMKNTVVEIVWDWILDSLEYAFKLADNGVIPENFIKIAIIAIPAMHLFDVAIQWVADRAVMTAEERIDEKYDVGAKSMEETIREQTGLRKRQSEGRLKSGGIKGLVTKEE